MQDVSVWVCECVWAIRCRGRIAGQSAAPPAAITRKERGNGRALKVHQHQHQLTTSPLLLLHLQDGKKAQEQKKENGHQSEHSPPASVLST